MTNSGDHPGTFAKSWTRAAVVMLAAAAAAALIASFWLTSGTSPAWNAVAWLAGIPAGFIVGLVTSPLGTADKQRLSAAGQIVTGFLSGFVVSKIDRLFEMAVQSKVVMGPSFLVPVAMFATSSSATAIAVFLVRSYVIEGA
jgi:hypothetical protein